jgi:hypothetical protein
VLAPWDLRVVSVLLHPSGVVSRDDFWPKSSI